MEKKIEICFGTARNFGMRARLSLMIVDGGVVMSEHFHSVAVLHSDDLDDLRGVLESHLGNPAGGIPGAPWPAIPDTEWAKVTGLKSVMMEQYALAEPSNLVKDLCAQAVVLSEKIKGDAIAEAASIVEEAKLAAQVAQLEGPQS